MTVLTAPRPYRGLAPFGDSDVDALLFFGREREREVIVANLLASPLTVLYGPSGVGKSSIIHAGVARRLRELEPLATVVVVDEWSTGAHLPAPDGEAFVLLDQLEEYFLYHGESGPLVDELPALLRRGDVHVLLSLRDDSLARLDAFAARLPGVLANRLRLEHLGRAEARAAIVGPLDRHNELAAPENRVTIEPALVDAVVDGVTAASPGEHVEAPYLQLVLERVWDVERAAGSPTMRSATLDRLGGAASVVREHLEHSIGTLPPHDAELASGALKFLVSPSHTKIAHSVDDLATFADEPRDELEDVLERLAAERIVRPVSADGQGRRYEIFHDVLAEPVLAWRRDFEVGRQRRAAERRHRRLLAVAGGALLVALCMAALALYALGQRSDARRHATAAQQQAAYAQTQRRRAVAQEVRARASAAEAQRQAAIARAARARAQQEALVAREQQQKAERASARARQASARAQANALEAKRQARVASTQRAAAQRQATRARVGELVAEAAAQLLVDPAASVQAALSAARLEQSPRVEESLRDSLKALRALAVLHGRGPVTDAVFSPGGERVAIASQSGNVREFATATHELERTLAAGAPVIALAFSPDGRILAAATGAGVRTWDAAEGTRLHDLQLPGVAGLAFTPGGSLVTLGRDVDVWGADGELVRSIPVGDRGAQLALSPDGALAAVRVVGTSPVVQVFALATGERVAAVQLAGEVVDLAFNPDGSLLGTAGRRNVYLWSTHDWQLQHLLTGATFTLTDVTFSNDGRVFVASEDSGARVYDAHTGTMITILLGQHQQRLTGVAVSADGTLVVTASADTTARVWPAPLGTTPVLLAGHRDAVTGVRIAPDGRTVLTWSPDGTARLWDGGAVTLARLGTHDGAVTAVGTSPDGRLAVSAGADGTARVWSFARGLVRTLHHDGPVTQALFLDDRRVLAASADGTARIWLVDTGAPVATLDAGSPIRAVAVVPGTGDVVTAGDDGIVRVWTQAGRLVWTSAPGGPVTAAAATAGLVAAGGAGGGIRVWRASDGARLRAFTGPAAKVSSLAFSPDGTLLASGSANATARIWHVSGAAKPAVLRGHRYAITSVAFSPDGRLLLTASVDGDARLWSVPTGRLVRTLRFHVSTVSRAVFSPDGRWIATAGPADAGLWETGSGRLFEYLSGLGGGALTDVAFTPDGRRLVTGSAGGAVSTYACTLCGPLASLVALADARLAALS